MSSEKGTATLPPVVKTLNVPLEVEAAFRRFTAELGEWWPLETHSVSQERAETAVFEGRVGGRLYERDVDGGEHLWGRVTVWEPPRRIVFTWHPGRTPDTAQRVEVSFEPEGEGTRLRLTHSGWEKLGPSAEEIRADYGPGWDRVLARYTG